MERGRLRLESAKGVPREADPEQEGEPQAAESARGRVPMRAAVADRPVVAMRPGNEGGANGTGHPDSVDGQLPGQEEPPVEPRPKPFAISKQTIWEAYRRVKANRGAAGVDGESIAEVRRESERKPLQALEPDVSGTYFPPPVRAVEIT